MRVACTYLVIAWPGNVTGDDHALREHRLLAQILQVLAANSVVPSDSLQGLLVDQLPALPLVTAQAEGFAQSVGVLDRAEQPHAPVA